MNLKIVAYQIAESLNIKKIRKEFKAELLEGSSFELFYKTGKNSYIYVLDYGALVLAGHDDPVESSKQISYFKEFGKGPMDGTITDDLMVHAGASRSSWTFDTLKVAKITQPVIKLAMLNVGQSVGLDYYSNVSQELLDETSTVFEVIEKRGVLTISRRNLFKFVGKAMNVRKKIIDNIYILNAPDTTWDDAELNRIHAGLQDVFDIKTRFRELDYQQQIQQDQLRMLTDVYQHNESNKLEIIIIILIFLELIPIGMEILKKI